MPITHITTSHYEETGNVSWSGKASQDTTGASFIAVVLTGFSQSSTLSDSQGNHYAHGTAQSNGNYGVTIWYTDQTITTGTTTWAVSAGDYSSVVVMSFSGITPASAFDKESGASAGATGNLQPGSLTPTNANSLFILGCNSSALSSLDLSTSGPTMTDTDNKGPDIQTLGSYLIQSGGPTAENPTVTAGGLSGIRGVAMVVFAPSGGGGGGRGLFRVPPLTGVGIGGSFFADPLQQRAVLIG